MPTPTTIVGQPVSAFNPIGAIASGVGDIASSAMSLYGQQKQMDFQRDMANTAHQREVKDLKAAGLNPILSATGGSGSATPSGASLSVPDFSNVGTQLTAAKQTQIAGQQANTSQRATTLQNILNNYQTDNLAAQTAKTLADTRLTNNQADNLAIQSGILNQIPALNLKLLQSQIPAAQSAANMYNGPLGFLIPYIQSALHGSQIFNNLSK